MRLLMSLSAAVTAAAGVLAVVADPPAAPDPPPRLDRLKAAKMPAVTKPVMFDTPEADAILSALEVFPPDNPWNTPVDDWPLHAHSAKLVGSVGADKPLRYNDDMAFVLVPPDQPKVPVKVTRFAAESDPGPFPVPDTTPIEGWPSHYRRSPKNKGLSLDEVQRNTAGEKGDRHAVVVDPANRMVYEFYKMRKGAGGGWAADGAATFDLKTNKLRPAGWTSADAAGLPIFPAVVRYDELKRGMVDHALRVTVRRTRKAYVYPATHYASRLTDADLPRMGERFRLKKDFDVSGFTPEMQAILKGLKQYGMLVADNGIEWAISVAPDPRIPNLNAELRKIKGSDFEVVVPPPGYKHPK